MLLRPIKKSWASYCTHVFDGLSVPVDVTRQLKQFTSHFFHIMLINTQRYKYLRVLQCFESYLLYCLNIILSMSHLLRHGTRFRDLSSTCLTESRLFKRGIELRPSACEATDLPTEPLQRFDKYLLGCFFFKKIFFKHCVDSAINRKVTG